MTNSNKAVFLDRDGVINYLVFNTKLNEYIAPHKIEDLKLFSFTIDSLKELQNLEYKLFVVSNQPDYAKGRTTLENLKIVHDKLHKIFTENNITFTKYYYCYHHPKGVVPEYTKICDCRKPAAKSLEDAKLNFGIDMKSSWFIGDRDSDIECGQKMGTKTILILEKVSANYQGKSHPDFKVNNLKEAVEVIKKSVK